MLILKFSNRKCTLHIHVCFTCKEIVWVIQDFFGFMSSKISHGCAALLWKSHGRKDTRLGGRDLSWGLGFVMDWLTWSLGQVASFLWTSVSSSLPDGGWTGWGNFQLQHSRFLWFHVILLLKHWPTLPLLIGSGPKFFNCYSRTSSFWPYPSFSASPLRLTYSSNDTSVFLLPIQIQFPCKASPKGHLHSESSFSGKDLYLFKADGHCCIFGPTHLLEGRFGLSFPYKYLQIYYYTVRFVGIFFLTENLVMKTTWWKFVNIFFNWLMIWWFSVLFSHGNELIHTF